MKKPTQPLDLQKALEDAEMRLAAVRGVLDAISEAIYIQDREGRFLDVNEGAARMYGYSREFLLGKTPELVSAPGRNDLAFVGQQVAQAFAGEPQCFSFWGLRRNGEVFPKEVRLYPGHYLGQPVVIAIAQDLSDRWREEQIRNATFRIAEAALAASDLNQLFSSMHGIVRDLMPADNFYIALHDRAAGVVSFPYWVDQTEASQPDRPFRRGLTEFVLRTGLPQLVDQGVLADLMARGEVAQIGPESLAWLGVPLSGSEGVFGVLAVQSYDGGYHYGIEERDLLSFVSSQVAMAIERKRMEASRWLMAMAVDRSQDDMFIIGQDGQIIFVNDSACRHLGYSRPELLSMRVSDIDPSRNAAAWSAIWSQPRISEVTRVETTQRRKDGSLRPVEISRSYLHFEGREVLFSSARDITERRAAEEALRASEEKFSRAFHASPDAINITRISDGTYLDVSEGFTRLTGWTRAEALGQSALDLGIWADPADRKRVVALLLEQGEFTGYEASFRTKDGHRFTGLMSGKRMEVDGIPCLLTFTRDITDQKQAQAALLAERGLFVGGPVMVVKWHASEGWPVDYVSPNIQAILGYTPEDLVSGRLSYDSLVHPEDLASIRQASAAYKARGLTHYEQQYRLRTATGEYRWFYDFTATVLEPGSGPLYYLGYLLDLTDRRQAEEAVRQAQKLESLGVLAGGIAHDFNNLLTAVLGNLNLAQMHLPGGAPAQTYLENMERAVVKAAELTKQMLAYSGRGRFQVQLLDLNLMVQEVTHLLEVSISKKVALHFDLHPGLPPIEADGAQIQQVVMNLVTNASDAIGEREGHIRISTGVETLDEAHRPAALPGPSGDRQALAPGRYVVLEAEDTGCGMSQEVLDRIFDPFFTTKSTGRGLGLSAMLRILRGHRAGLRITSTPGQGSTFRLYFPATQAEALAQPVSTPEPRADILRGRVLVVDDEDLILESTGAVLSAMGFEVLTARDGLEALALVEAHRGALDLVLMDMTMPRMDGREAFLAMRRLDPNLPVILSSGFTEQDSLQAFGGESPAAFIQKPYQLKELRRLIQGVLGET